MGSEGWDDAVALSLAYIGSNKMACLGVRTDRTLSRNGISLEGHQGMYSEGGLLHYRRTCRRG